MADLERTPVFAALYEPVLVLGLPRSVLGPEVTLAGLGAYALGWSLWTPAFVAVFAFVVHPLLLRAVRDDPEALEVFVRSLRIRDVYQPCGGHRTPTVPFCAALPER